MAHRSTPQYIRFARALALVSVALPMPAVTVLGAAACSSSTTSPPPGSPAYRGEDSGSSPAPGSPAMPEMDSGDDGGMQVAEAGGGGVQALDASSDASDDGGGPHRGTPELPASFLALMG